MLEPVSTPGAQFRITMYDPDVLRRTHAPGRHQYLIARPVLEADVVINIPKLKCHKKAGMTAALKNLVGINGNKEFLPHHRKGGSRRGGDCYDGDSVVQRIAEDILDVANHQKNVRVQHFLTRLSSAGLRRWADGELEGSWHGNDTVWRMCLDLNRILLYGDSEGALSPKPVRSVMHITDAIIGGEGEGPLAPTAVPAGFITGAMNAAAADWVNAYLMGFDPRKISLTRNAFAVSTYPLAEFLPDAIRIQHHGTTQGADAARQIGVRRFRAPAGWAGHCELNEE